MVCNRATNSSLRLQTAMDRGGRCWRSTALATREPLESLRVVTWFAIFQPQPRFLYFVKETARLLPTARR
jgi:hypothetical protein